MSKLTHGLLQALGIVIQIVNLSFSIVPAKYQPVVAALVAAAQAALALYNHTPAAGQNTASKSLPMLFISGLLLLCAPRSQAQGTLPGWNVAINGNFLNITNAATNNGFASVEAVRVANNWDLRADQLTLVSPSGGTIALFRAEYRFLLSSLLKPNAYVNTSNFEPFINVGGGIANSNDASGSTNRPAFVVGAGFDYLVSSTGMFTLRPLDISYVRASILQGGGEIIGNHLQLMSGIGVNIGSPAAMTRNKAARAAIRAQYHLDQ
jgi:hypothetical protein